MPYQVKVNGETLTPEQYEEYKARHAQRARENMSDILRDRQAPGLNGTDKAFRNGCNQGDLLKRFGPKKLAKLKEKWKKAGYNVDQGWEYYGELNTNHADPYDPMGLVAPTDTRGDVARRIEKTGNAAHGAITVKGRPGNGAERVHKLNPRIVKRKMHEQFRKDPALLEKCKKDPRKVKELEEAIVHKHAVK